MDVATVARLHVGTEKKDEKETKEEEKGGEELEREMVCIANSLPLQTRGPKKASASPHNDKSISVPLPNGVFGRFFAGFQ